MGSSDPLFFLKNIVAGAQRKSKSTKALSGSDRAFKTVKKAAAFLTKGLHPAAAHSLSAVGGQFARLQGEKYFRPRTRRGRK
jgi:hypothetical protein